MGIKERLLRKEKEVKSVVYIDNKNNVRVAYDNFETLCKEYGEDEVIKIYKPTIKQRPWIEKILKEEMQIYEKTVEAGLSSTNTYKLIDELSSLGLKLDLNDKEDREYWERIINDPSDLMLAIRREIDEVATFLFKIIVENTKEFMDLPKEIRSNIIEINKNKILKQEVERKKREYENKKKELEILKGELDVK